MESEPEVSFAKTPTTLKPKNNTVAFQGFDKIEDQL